MRRLFAAILMILTMLCLTALFAMPAMAAEGNIESVEHLPALETIDIAEYLAATGTVDAPEYLAAGEGKGARALLVTIKKNGEELVLGSGWAGEASVLPWTTWELKAYLCEDVQEGWVDVTGLCEWYDLVDPERKIDPSQVIVGNPGDYGIGCRIWEWRGYPPTGIICALRATREVEALYDEFEVSCALLSELTAENWGVLSEYVGSTIEEYVIEMESVGQGSERILASKAAKYKNTATLHHLLMGITGDFEILGTMDESGLQAAAYKHDGKTYIAYGYGDIFTNNYYEAGNVSAYLLRAFNFYQNYAGEDTIVTGRDFGGTIATMVSYIMGCRSVTFGAVDPAPEAVREDFSAFIKNYKGGEQTNYVLTKATMKNREGTVYQMLEYDMEREDVMLSNRVAVSSAGLRAVQRQSLGDIIVLGENDTDHINVLSCIEEFDVLGYQGVYSYTFGGNGDDTIWESKKSNYEIVTDPDEFKERTWKILYESVKTEASIRKNGILKTITGMFPDIKEIIGDYVNESIKYYAGGKGDDQISGTLKQDRYCYRYGDGHDYVYDAAGIDDVFLIGCENKEIEFNVDGDDLHIYVGGSPVISMSGGLMGLGAINVYRGNPHQSSEKVMRFPRKFNAGRVYSMACPVEMHVYDPDGNQVRVIGNDTEFCTLADYGIFGAELVDGEYVKTAILFEDGYTVRGVGIGDGEMDYQVSFFDIEQEYEEYRAANGIPVTAGSVFYPYNTYEAGVLRIDIDGDGVIDAELDGNTSIALAESEMELSLGDTHQFVPIVIPAEKSKDAVFVSLNEDIVTIDEAGLATAVGFGETAICVSVPDGSVNAAACKITVPEETLSAEDFRIEGLQESYTATGDDILPEITVWYKALPEELTFQKHYQVTFENNIEPGTATMTIEGIAPYEGTITRTFEITPAPAMTLEQKVDKIAAQCRSLGYTKPYDIAFWLHNYLIYNANYDQTYTWYSPEGVLLHGTGVCQSYTEAYALLLDEFSIENQSIISEEMDHSWNLLKLSDNWYHVDCTWDDPVPGGYEHGGYFMLSDEQMEMDHTWDHSAYPAALDGSRAYNLVYGGYTAVSTEDEVIEVINQSILDGVYEVRIMKADADLDLDAAYRRWIDEESWRFRYTQCGYSMSGPSMVFYIEMDGSELELVIDYTGDMQALERDLRAYLAAGKVEITIHDSTADAADEWDPSELYDIAAELIGRLSPDYGCTLSNSYSYMPTEHSVILTLSYITADTLPEPFETIEPVKGSNFVYAGLGGAGDIAKADMLGKRFAVVYGASTCYNTKSLLSALQAADSLLRDVDIPVILESETGAESVMAQYDRLTFGVQEDSSAMWYDILSVMGNVNSVYYPVVFVYDAQGRIIYASTGYVDEPLRLVALLREEDELPQEPEEPEEPLEYVFTLPSALKTISGQAFANNPLLDGVVLGKDVTEIGEGAFENCVSLRSVNLPDGLVSIGESAFSGCVKLREIEIPDSVVSIGTDAFAGCEELVIICSTGSEAYWYATANQIEMKLTDAE